MDCPQCDGTLATYALGGQEASVCEDCGYVGIPAEHRGEPRRIESWDDAFRRFYRAQGADAEPGVELRPPLSRPSEGSSDESWDDALRRFHERRTSDDESDATGSEEGVDEGESDATGSDDSDRAGDASAETSAAGTDGDGDGAATRTQSSAGDS